MVTLKDEISSQENMEQWMSQLGHPENPISNKGVLVRLQPQFVQWEYAERSHIKDLVMAMAMRHIEIILLMRSITSTEIL